MELECAVQTYDWGRRGSKSVVAKLAKASNSEFILEENKPYAELWMGTHQNGPSRLKKNSIYLKDYINENKHVLGPKLAGSYDNLPFLFKVLSVGKALSIQTHPDKVSFFSPTVTDTRQIIKKRDYFKISFVILIRGRNQ